MLTIQQKDSFSSLKVELIDLNILTYCYVKKHNRIGYLFKKTTRDYIFEEFNALRYMENGIILHLTNLDDDKSEFSFRAIQKEINKSTKDQKKLNNLKIKLDNYRRSLNKLKNQHRNNRIAHMSYIKDLNLDEFLNFDSYLKPLIFQANQIGDFLWGEKIIYKIRLGSQEGDLDFRKIFESLKFDINGQKDFV
ncbi:MAG: hypothetical protein V4585_04060 [Bacteroidota bacterium]